MTHLKITEASINSLFTTTTPTTITTKTTTIVLHIQFLKLRYVYLPFRNVWHFGT